MDFEKQKSKNFDKVMKDSKSFIVAHTEYYEPQYSNSVQCEKSWLKNL